MKKIEYLIIGGGVAGTTAAEFIRMNDASGSITIIEEEPETLYSRVLIPHFLRGETSFERLHIRKQEQYEETNIELLKGVQVGSVDTKNKKVTLSDSQEIGYEKLLIASGTKVNELKVPGGDLDGVCYLRTIEDVKKVSDLIGNVKDGVVVGGGFIGIDFAEIFAKAGLKTTCIIREPYFWNDRVGENSGKLINKILENNGVEVISNSEVSEFVGGGSLESIKLSNGRELTAEIAGIGVGVHADLEYLKNSGIKTGKGVATNEYLETSTINVWAAGDVAEFKDTLFGKHHQLGNWSNAVAQSKVVGGNMVAGWGSSIDNRERFVTVSAYTISIFNGNFTMLGDTSVDSKTELIERGSVREEKLGRLHVRDDRIIGASLINLHKDRSPITKLIENQVKINVSKEKLADINFGLESLLNS
jgi:NAD(P)H-nitrite reductase large subunit